jgi:hypothetical protein
VRCTVGRRGSLCNAEYRYFRRQSDICLRLSMIVSSEEVASELVLMAREYAAKADMIEVESGPLQPTISAMTDRNKLTDGS